MDFKDATERRAWLLARVEEVERRRNLGSKTRLRRMVRAYAKAHPGSTVNEIAIALGLTREQVRGTGVSHPENDRTV